MALMDPFIGPWTSAEAAHLARRTTFGAAPAELSSLVAAGMSAAVNGIVGYADVDQPLEDKIASLSTSVRTSEHSRLKDPVDARDLEGWWLYRMVHSTQPFQQQFALFLHDHFVSEYGKIRANVTNRSNDGNDGSVTGQQCTVTSGGLAPDPTRERRIVVRLFQDQHKLFLGMGHGPFRDMLIAITRDPCMLIYLDNRLNRKGKAQENYAREVMELFSMGVGNYSEQDVREVARAFTGETIRVGCQLNWPYDYTFNANQHDTGLKTVFGQTFNQAENGADTVRVIDLILNRISNSSVSPYHGSYPATALYMSWKFLRWFVNDALEMDHPAVAELAAIFYSNQGAGRYDVRETLRRLFKSQFFYDVSNHNKIYKHPADYVVSALRNLKLDEPSFTGVVYNRMRQMGMRLFEPPTVDGWQHGKSWINSSSLVARFNYADRLSSGAVLSNAEIEALRSGGHVDNYDDDLGIMRYFTSRLLQDEPSSEEAAIFAKLFRDIKGSATNTTAAIFYRKVRAALHLTMTMPRYQLK